MSDSSPRNPRGHVRYAINQVMSSACSRAFEQCGTGERGCSMSAVDEPIWSDDFILLQGRGGSRYYESRKSHFISGGMQ